MTFRIIDSPHVHGIEESIDSLVELLRHEDEDRFLYRGQAGLFGPNGDYTRQVPSVFRGCLSTEEATARMRNSHLQIAWLFDQVRTALNNPSGSALQKDLAWAAINLGNLDQPNTPLPMLGIAQHYGVRTQMLDLTFLDPAAVFASQRWLTITEAARLPQGASAPVRDSPICSIYRYDRQAVSDFGIFIGDLSTGNAGSRPIVQEGRTIALDYDQDRLLFAKGAYEVFLFRNREPYTYSRPIRPSPLLNEDQKQAVTLASGHSPGSPFPRSASFSMRDFVLPSFYFSPLYPNTEAWEVVYGLRPDPFLGLGTVCENHLREEESFDSMQNYATKLFGTMLGRSVSEHDGVRKAASRQRARAHEGGSQ